MINKHSLFFLGIMLVGMNISEGHVYANAAYTYQDYQQEQSSVGLDLYKQIYEKYDAIVEHNALKRTVEDINKDPNNKYTFTEADIVDITQNKIDLKKLRERTHEDVSKEIFDKVLSTYQFEKNMADYELSLQMETGNLGLYSNGTTDDSSFDIVVDLNIIDVIFFGEKSETPIAYWSSYTGFLQGSGDTGGSGNGNNGGGFGQNTNTNSTNTNRNSKTENTNTNEGCNNPNTFIISDAQTKQDLAAQLAALRQKITNLQNQIANGNTNAQITDINTPPAENGNNNSSPPLERPGGDSPYTRAQDMEGSSLWPCSTYFCVKITMKKGSTPTYGNQDNSYTAHAQYIYQYLSKLDALPLDLKSTSKGFFAIGTHAIDFVKRLNLKVVVTNKPVWNPKTFQYKANTPDATIAKTKADRAKSIQDAQAATSQSPLPASTVEQRILSYLVGTSSQEEMNNKLTDIYQEINNSETERSIANRMEARTSIGSIDTDPWKAQVFEMKASIASLVESFREMSETAKKFLTEKQPVSP